MVDLSQSNTINLIGEIVSIYEKDKIQFAKIHYDPGFVDLKIDTKDKIYLNDRVIINSKLEVEKINTQNEKNEYK